MCAYLVYLSITFINDTSNKRLSYINLLFSIVKHMTFCETNSTLTIMLYSSTRSNLTKFNI